MAFSRTRTSRDMIIVGGPSYAIPLLWQLITTQNQYTDMMENILQMVTINPDPVEGGNGNALAPQQNVLHYADHFPFQLSSGCYPSDSSGAIYLLLSLRDPRYSYIGETECLNQRLRRHNTGHGAIGTADPSLRPFAIGAYITGLAHKDRTARMSLEGQWQQYRSQLTDDSLENIIRQGERVVEDNNSYAAQNGIMERIHLVRMVRSDN